MPSSLLNQKTTHPLQTKAWGDFFEAINFDVIYRNVSGASGNPHLIILQKNQINPYRFAYMPRADFPDAEQFRILNEIIEQHSCFSMKIEPNICWPFPLSASDQNEQNRLIQIIKSKSGRPSNPLYALHTMLIPLNSSEEELLEHMHQKTRYNIRLSERQEIIVSQETTDECFEEFLSLFFDDTMPRAGIDYAHSKENLRIFWNVMKPTGNLFLLKAAYKKETTAVMVLFRIHDRLYFPHGASSRKYQNLMSNYALLWQAMRLGKELECSALDLWGIREPLAFDENGLFRFYSGFGAMTYKWLGAFDFLMPEYR